MTGHRMSSLPIVEICGAAPLLSDGAGRSAVMSSAFHAVCSESADAIEKMARLTEDEQEEIWRWHKPETFEVAGATLDYVWADTELEVSIDRYGWAGSADPITVGHLDFGWCLERDERRLAVVMDIKRGLYTSAPDTLQLHAYGTAYAALRECEAYVTGIWAAESGEASWSDRFVVIGSPEHEKILSRIAWAASNSDPEPRPGTHCAGCWSREHCSAWTLPGALAETWLAPLVKGQLGTPEELGELVLKVKAAKELTEKAEKILKAHRLAGNPIRLNGEDWTPYEVRGRESTSVEKVREKFGEEAESIISRGPPHFRFKWTKPKGKERAA